MSSSCTPWTWRQAVALLTSGRQQGVQNWNPASSAFSNVMHGSTPMKAGWSTQRDAVASGTHLLQAASAIVSSTEAHLVKGAMQALRRRHAAGAGGLLDHVSECTWRQQHTTEFENVLKYYNTTSAKCCLLLVLAGFDTSLHRGSVQAIRIPTTNWTELARQAGKCYKCVAGSCIRPSAP